MKKILFRLIVSTLVILLLGCGEQEKQLELCPLKDGNILVYEGIKNTRKIGGKELFNIPMQFVYKITSEKNKEFKIDYIIRGHTEKNQIFDNNISDKQGAHLFDEYGRLLRRTKGKISSKLKGNFTKLWLPASKRKAGATVGISMNTSQWKVTGPVKWEGWNTWKLTCSAKYAKSSYYYDTKTGYLVGNTNQRLVETNIPDLSVAESKIPQAFQKLKGRVP